MASSILYPELRRLLDQGAQLVEVLPPEGYVEEHAGSDQHPVEEARRGDGGRPRKAEGRRRLLRRPNEQRAADAARDDVRPPGLMNG